MLTHASVVRVSGRTMQITSGFTLECIRTPARLSEIHLKTIQRKKPEWVSEKHLVLTTNTNKNEILKNDDQSNCGR